MVLLFALVGGLAIAFTFQILFANLGLALGLTILNFSPRSKSSQPASQSDSAKAASPDQPKRSLPVTNLLGAGVMLSATSTIFVAALISTEFSTLLELRRGIIFGLIVWAVYWLLFIWLSTTTLTSVVESLLGTLIAGGKELLSLTKRAYPSAATEASEQASEEAMLKAMSEKLSAELAQIAKTQQALPTLLAKHRETLVAEVCDRTQLSRNQAETILNGVQPSETQVSTSTAPSSMGLLANLGSTAKSTVLSAVESQIDVPSWQQVSQKIIDNVDISDLESLWQQTASFLGDSNQAATESEKEIQPDTIPIQQDSTASQNNQRKKQPSAATKAVQKKLIAYVRYTNPDALTPDNLLEKVAAQQNAKEIEDLSATQLDVDAIANVIINRKTLPAPKKQALVKTLQTAIAPPVPPAPPATSVQPSAPAPTATNASHASNASNTSNASNASNTSQQLTHTLEQTKDRIAQYLYSQNKTTLQPKQIAHDLTRIVGSSLQSIPHPSQLPERSQLANLWDKSFWQRALAQRKDMTGEEMQQVLHWVESGWEPMTHQANDWIQAMQAEASQLLEVPEEIIDEARQQIVEQIGAVKENVEEQAIALKTELQIQADSARHQAAIAAWWLFSAILLSSVTAGSASWLAIRY
ncbi:MAG: hypothetical protein AB8B99_17435 [Phormidesmis sp.]